MNPYVCEKCGRRTLVTMPAGFAWVCCDRCGGRMHAIRNGAHTRLMIAIALPAVAIIVTALLRLVAR